MAQHFTVFWTDNEGNILEEVARREENATVQGNADGDLKLVADITVHGVPAWVNPYEHRVLIQREGVSLGLFLIDSDTQRTQRNEETTKLSLVDPLQRLQEVKLTKPLTVGAGVNVAERVAQLVRLSGETRLAVTPGTQKTVAPQVWMAGEHDLKTPINELLDAANYFGIHTNRAGEFVIKPYVLPKDRPVVHRFVAGDGSRLVGEYEQERNYREVPNRFIGVCEDYRPQGSNKAPVTFVGVAENKNPASPFSFQARNNTWVDFYERIEATSQKEANAIAARKLAAITGGGDFVEVKHAFLPNIWLHDAVHVETAAGDRFTATVNEFTIPERGLVSARWRKVVDLK